ncbi:hypothetical protein GN956_G7282 [Arapaima gigas]
MKKRSWEESYQHVREACSRHERDGRGRSERATRFPRVIVTWGCCARAVGAAVRGYKRCSVLSTYWRWR